MTTKATTRRGTRAVAIALGLLAITGAGIASAGAAAASTGSTPAQASQNAPYSFD